MWFRTCAMLSLSVFLPLPILATPAAAQAADTMTPALLAVQDAPVPFRGSDGQVHLVYELWITNFSSSDIAVERVEVLGDGAVLQTLDRTAVENRLQPVGQRQSTGTLAKSTQALLFLNVALGSGVAIPQELSHRVTVGLSAAPPGMQQVSESGGKTRVDKQAVVEIGAPLAGERYISADSCCDATRHTRAALPVNGRVWISQRYAVDWEQMSSDGKIYTGPQEKLESYAIFGQRVLAVADARVVSVIDGLPEQTPGKFPANIPLTEADGNSVTLDLGAHRYAMYAHMQPGSIRVKAGDRVKAGQMIGLVGDSGNSIVPHLHFQVTDGPSSFSANGLPYEIRSFEVTGKTPGTAAFDEAETNGTPLPVTVISPPQKVTGAMPLDQRVITFAGH